MNNVDRQRLVNLLIGDIRGKAREIVEEMCILDVERIEPLIDEMIASAVRLTFAHGCVVIAGAFATCKCGARINSTTEYECHVILAAQGAASNVQ